MNRITLSTDLKFVECWNNGNRIYFVPVRSSLHDSVGIARDYLRKWSGEEPTLSNELSERLKAIDATFTRLAFSADYR